MRRCLAIVLFVCTSVLHAQDWALLDPAYKYNYSLGGTDTITNQIFVTHIDTLGPDSFRYALNRIAVGGSYVLLDQPQFLGLTCTTNGHRWDLDQGTHHLLLLSDAAAGTIWLYDTLNSIMATMGSSLAGSVLGSPDSLRSVLLSTGESIVLSRDHGVVSMPNGSGMAFIQIGEQTSGVGILLPTLGDFFPYDVGDLVEYSFAGDILNNNSGHQSGAYLNVWIRYSFTARDEVGDQLLLSCDALSHKDQGSWATFGGGYSTSTTTYADTAGILGLPYPMLPGPELIGSYPGQVVFAAQNTILGLGASWPAVLISEYAPDTSGNIVLRSRLGMRYAISSDSSYAVGVLGAPDFEFTYRIGMGIVRYKNHVGGMSGHDHRLLEFHGSVIDGDTIGTLFDDLLLTQVPSRAIGDMSLFPNPADEQLMFDHPRDFSGEWSIRDMTGRLLLAHNVDLAGKEPIDVSALFPGTYLFCVTTTAGTSAQPFVIAR